MNANLASYDDKDTLKSESTVEFLGPPQNKVEFQETISFVNKIKVKLLFCFVEFQLQMLVPSSLMLIFFFFLGYRNAFKMMFIKHSKTL